MQYNTIFSQLFNFIPRHRFDSAVSRGGGDHYCKRFTAWRQFLTCLYAQITGKDSLREIEQGLLANERRLYHLGMQAVPRSSLSDAMNRRSPDFFKALFDEILERATGLAANHGFRFRNPLYAIDSTVIDLCISQYSWARYRRTKGAIKLHTQLDLSGNLPCYVVMSDGKMSDIHAAKTQFPIRPDSIYVYDKGYCDLRWFNEISLQGAYFVTRLRCNSKTATLGQHSHSPSATGVVSDEEIVFSNFPSLLKYPVPLRKVTYVDQEAGRRYEFLTNNFRLAAHTIARIYRRRWQIELFFKWIKQNLKIKSFLGTTRNAVMTQIWVALIHYLLVAYIKQLTRTAFTMTEITRGIRETLMMAYSLLEVLNLEEKVLQKPPDWNRPQQLELFGEFFE